MNYHITSHYLYNISNRRKEFIGQLVAGIQSGKILPKCDEAVFALIIRHHDDRMFSAEGLRLYLDAHPEHFPVRVFLLDETLPKEDRADVLSRIADYSCPESELASFFLKSVMVTHYISKIANKAKWDEYFNPALNGEVSEQEKYRCIDAVYKAVTELLGLPKLHMASWNKGEKGFCSKTAIDFNGKRRAVLVSRPLSKHKDERKAVINSVFYNLSKYILYVCMTGGEQAERIMNLFDLSKVRVSQMCSDRNVYESDLNDIYSAFWVFYTIFDGIGG